MKVAVIAVGTRGDVEPHLALASGLRTRGHDVKLAAPLDFAPAAAELGLNFHPLRVSFRGLYDTSAGAMLQTTEQDALALIRNLKDVAVAIAGQIITDIRAACVGVEAVCYSLLGMPAYYCAREMGIPAVATGLQPLGRTRTIPSPVLTSRALWPGPWNLLSHVGVEQVFWQLFRALMRGRELPGVSFWGHFNELYRGRAPMLFGYSPVIVPRPADFRPHMHVTGFWALPPRAGWSPPAALAQFLADGPPPVCLGFGSMNSDRIAGILEAAVHAVTALGQRAVILTGWWKPKMALPASSRCFITEAVPHAWLFPRVAAVVHHGGAGTTAATLRAGVPSIIVPFFFDQTFWAQRLHQLGLGPGTIRFAEISSARFQAAFAAVAAPAVVDRLRTARRQLETEDGVGNAIAVLENSWNGARS